MIDIYICEDNKLHLEYFSQYINDTIIIEGLDMNIALATANPHELLEHVATSKNIGLFFFDIDLNSDIDGLSLAKEIRRLQPRCFIIFVTSHSEMSFLTFQYKVEALDFIIKSDMQSIKSKIHDCLLDVAEKYSSLNNSIQKTFTIPLDERRIIIDYTDIMCFETSDNIHKVILHAKNRMIEFPAQLKDIERQLDSNFYRCHRSCIININNIREADFQTGKVTMATGETYPISIRAKNGLKRKFSNM